MPMSPRREHEPRRPGARARQRGRSRSEWGRAARVTVGGALLLAVAACGDGGSTAAPSSTAATTSPATTSPATTSPATPSTAAATSSTTGPSTPPPTTGLPGAGTTPVSTPPGENGPGLTALLSDVRTGRHDGYERVVFEFAGEVLPGSSVRYEAPPFVADPSGEPVAVSGGAFLAVRMAWASGFDLSGDLGQVYTGPTRLVVGAPVVSELVQTGDFEAVLDWVIGLDGRHPFRVSTLDDPVRLVIDFPTAPAGAVP